MSAATRGPVINWGWYGKEVAPPPDAADYARIALRVLGPSGRVAFVEGRTPGSWEVAVADVTHAQVYAHADKLERTPDDRRRQLVDALRAEGKPVAPFAP